MDERIVRRLKLRDLHTLQAVVQCRSMAKAATRLAITQPAISKTISEIEHTIGVPLLERSPRGVTPTAYGQALLKHSLAIFDELRQSIREIEFLSDPTTGEVRVGSPEALTAFLAAVIDRMTRRYPQITYQVVAASDMDRLYRELRERKIDLVLTRMATPEPEPDLDAEILFEDALAVVAAKSNRWHRKRKIDLADLMDEHWAVMPDDFLMSFIREAFAARDLQLPKARVLSLSLAVRTSLLATGRFIGIFPSFMLKLPKPHPCLKPLAVSLPTTRRPIGVLTLKKRTLSPAGQLFVEIARQVARPFAGNGSMV
jgi:DNA-binding transcriptional LysR family regulator